MAESLRHFSGIAMGDTAVTGAQRRRNAGGEVSPAAMPFKRPATRHPVQRIWIPQERPALLLDSRAKPKSLSKNKKRPLHFVFGILKFDKHIHLH